MSGKRDQVSFLPNDRVHGLTASELHQLSEVCLTAKSLAYCPYSHFHVGCALLLHNGTYISGANVENAAYPVTTCAERVAVCAAVVNAGIRRGAIKAVAVSSDLKEGDRGAPCSPCGMCRQALREFCDDSVPIFLYHPNGKYIVKTLGELLPMSFGPESLPPPHELPEAT